MHDIWEEAKHDYFRDKALTLKKLADKYHLNISEVQKRSAAEGWHRRKMECEASVPDEQAYPALSQSAKINEIAEKLLENIRLSSEVTDKPTSIYNLTSALKNLTVILRDVNDLPSLKDRQSYELAKVKLELAKTKSEDANEEQAGGVVMLPEVAGSQSEQLRMRKEE